MSNQGDKYDKYENKHVIFTTWDNIKQHVFIKKNDKENKRLEVIDVTTKNDIHYLIYDLIGTAVVKIEEDFK